MIGLPAAISEKLYDWQHSSTVYYINHLQVHALHATVTGQEWPRYPCAPQCDFSY